MPQVRGGNKDENNLNREKVEEEMGKKVTEEVGGESEEKRWDCALGI